ncbi:MAG: response regulator transcription factor [bacterium]
MIKVAIADDHAIVRYGISQLISSQKDMRVVGEASCGREAIDIVNKLKPDALILDIELPDIDGISVTKQLHASQPDSAILILTMYDSEMIAKHALRSGAMGYIIKGTDPNEIPEAIREVANCKPYVTKSIRDKMLLSMYHSDHDNPVSFLSTRELQILIEVAKGNSNAEISKKLCLSSSAVKTYKQRMIAKLGLDNITELIRFCMRHSLIDKY